MERQAAKDARVAILQEIRDPPLPRQAQRVPLRLQGTRRGTEMKGTILDPTLGSFKDYSLTNEIYAVGYILSFIFTGRTAPHVVGENLGAIVRRCTDLTVENRYQRVQEIISDVTDLKADNYLR